MAIFAKEKRMLMKRFLIAMTVVLCFSSCVYDDDADSGNSVIGVSIGHEAPDFTLTADGFPDRVRLSSFRGKHVVLEFWASWCPDCEAATPAMLSLYDSCKGDDVVFIGVSFDTDEAEWRSYVAENKMEWTQYSELKPWHETHVDALYSVKWIPALVLIDPTGLIVYSTDNPSSMESEILKLKRQRGERAKMQAKSNE